MIFGNAAVADFSRLDTGHVLHCDSPMDKQGHNTERGFIRLQFSPNGMMCLYCARCDQLVAYSPHSEILAKVEAIHELRCMPVSPLTQ